MNGNRDPVKPAHGPRRRALVTGASSGIGEVFARRLARDAYNLVLVARSGEALEALAKELREQRGVDVEVIVADLTRGDDLRRVEERAAAEPALDLLVNNAGFGTFGAFADSDANEEEREILLNVVALTRLARAALPRMLSRGVGAIINVSSLAAYTPSPYFASYAATKAYVNSLTEGLAEELRGSGVRVQALCPGFTRTRFQERAGVDESIAPSFAWMEPEPVVEASLAALERGDVICIPGLANRLSALAVRATPRSVVSRLMGGLQKRRLGAGN